jgi:hypothetical protein
MSINHWSATNTLEAETTKPCLIRQETEVDL